MKNLLISLGALVAMLLPIFIGLIAAMGGDPSIPMIHRYNAIMMPNLVPLIINVLVCGIVFSVSHAAYRHEQETNDLKKSV